MCVEIGSNNNNNNSNNSNSSNNNNNNTSLSEFNRSRLNMLTSIRRYAPGLDTLLLIVTFATLSSSGSALRLHGTIRAGNSWTFLDSFCFQPTLQSSNDERGVFEYSVVMPRNSRVSLLFYYEGQGDLEKVYYGDELTCHEKYDLASQVGNSFPLFNDEETRSNRSGMSNLSPPPGVALIDPPTQQQSDINAFAASINSPVKRVSVSRFLSIYVLEQNLI